MRPYRRISALLAVALLLLIANLSWLQVLGAEGIRRHEDNTRQLLEQYNRARGPIIVGADPIATSSRATADGFYQRSYTDGPLYSAVTGFYSLLYGATGIERAQDAVLSGTDSRFFVDRIQQLFAGRHLAGGAVTLTIDAEAQRAAFSALGTRPGAAVAIDANTGAIVALVSTPAFDPQSLAPNDPEAVRTAYARLVDDPAQPLRNRAVSQAYPTGSLFQVITAAAALASGDYTLASALPSPARFTDGSTVLRKPSSCRSGADVTLAVALQRGCSTAFAWLGQQLGRDALRSTAEQFGFGTAYTFFGDLTPSAPSVLPADAAVSSAAAGAANVRATVLQMALVAAALANDGTLMNPYLVSDVRAQNLVVLDNATPTTIGTPLSSRAAQALASTLATRGTSTMHLLTASDGRAWALAFADGYAVAVCIEDAAADAQSVARSVLAVLSVGK